MVGYTKEGTMDSAAQPVEELMQSQHDGFDDNYLEDFRLR